MKLNEQSFPSTRLGRIEWEGYLEAGKVAGRRDRFIEGSEFDAAYKSGWDKRTAELEAA